MKKLHPESIDALKSIKERSKDKRVVFVSGYFNIVHPGHLRLLRFASECGDLLVVGVLPHRSGITMIPEDLRLEAVQSTSWIDFAFVLRDAPADFISELQPAIVVKGKEHESQNNPELKALKQYGGKLLFSSGDVSFSSVNLLREEFKLLSLSTITKPLDYPQRHGFSFNDLESTVDRIKNLKVAVIGDIIVDEYITCDPIGMSQEEPAIVVTPVFEDRFLGGAGIVAGHAKGLGAAVSLFSAIGKDEVAGFVRNRVEELGIRPFLYEDDSRPTIIKQRFRAKERALLRVNRLRQHPLSNDLQERVFHDISTECREIDILIFADFNYGCLPQPLVERIAKFCAKRGVLMIADSQSSSQFGDISRFVGMQLLAPTEREARLAVRDNNSGLVVIAEKLRQKTKCRNLIITMGGEGALIYAGRTDSKDQWLTDRLYAMNTAPKDLSGAGDSFTTACGLSLSTGADIWQSAYLGSLVAACQVARVGNIPLAAEDILAEIND